MSGDGDDQEITSACVVIQRGDFRVLGVSRTPTSSKWGLPGGSREAGETPAGTAARELYEETGVRPLTLTLLCVGPSAPGERTAIYYCPAPIGQPCKGTAEGRVGWVTWQTLFAGPFGAQNRQAREALWARFRAQYDALRLQYDAKRSL